MAWIESWKPVPGFGGLYEVSDKGRVRSWHPWKGQPTPRLLRPHPDGDGYLQLNLSTGGVGSKAKVHRLVLLAFRGKPPSGSVVRHLDGDRTNNRLDNLAYGTRSENARDAIRQGTHHNASVTHCPRGHEYTIANTYVPPSGTGRHCRICRAADRRARRAAARGR